MEGRILRKLDVDNSDEPMSLEKRKRRLIEHAEPLMGADDAQRLAGLLRPGAAPTLATLARRGVPRRPASERRDEPEER